MSEPYAEEPGACSPLVVLDEADDLVLLGELDELQVVLEELHRGLRHQDVHAALDRVFRNVIVGVYGRASLASC